MCFPVAERSQNEFSLFLWSIRLMPEEALAKISMGSVRLCCPLFKRCGLLLHKRHHASYSGYLDFFAVPVFSTRCLNEGYSYNQNRILIEFRGCSNERSHSANSNYNTEFVSLFRMKTSLSGHINQAPKYLRHVTRDNTTPCGVSYPAVFEPQQVSIRTTICHDWQH